MEEFATVLYYLIASNLLLSGGRDGDCLTMAHCLEQITKTPILTEELARSKSESLDYRLLVMGYKIGDKHEHHELMRDMSVNNLRNSQTYEQAVKLLLSDDRLALGLSSV